MIWGWRSVADSTWVPPNPRGRRNADLVDAEVVRARRREWSWLVALHVALLALAATGWAMEAAWGRGAPLALLGTWFQKICAVAAGFDTGIDPSVGWTGVVVMLPAIAFAFRRQLLAGAVLGLVLVAVVVLVERGCRAGIGGPEILLPA